jgi:hypothetical protein
MIFLLKDGEIFETYFFTIPYKVINNQVAVSWVVLHGIVYKGDSKDLMEITTNFSIPSCAVVNFYCIATVSGMIRIG